MTDAEKERLYMLMEEAAEVIHICGKILRHGYESRHPHVDSSVTNREYLRRECIDFLVVLNKITEQKDIKSIELTQQEFDKLWDFKNEYTHHQ